MCGDPAEVWLNDGFRQLAVIEGVPDIASIAADPSGLLRNIAKIRARHSSVRFREWLSANPSESNAELTRRYVDAIADRKGFFDRAPGKVAKGLVMTAAGVGLGVAIEGGLAGVAAGGLSGKLLEPAADFALDLLDTFVLDGLLSGWTPKHFMNQLRQAKQDTRGSE